MQLTSQREVGDALGFYNTGRFNTFFENGDMLLTDNICSFALNVQHMQREPQSQQIVQNMQGSAQTQLNL